MVEIFNIMKVTIYTLSNPLNNEVKYVGKTTQSLEKRLNGHLHKKGKSYVTSWIKSLKNKNLKPIIEEIDIVDNDNWSFWEQYYINLFKTWGFKLTNLSCGGESGKNGVKMTEKQKQHLSQINIGKSKITLKGRLQLSKARKEYFIQKRKNKEFKYQQDKPVKEKYLFTKQHCEKISKSLKGKKNPDYSRKCKVVYQYDKDNNFIKEWKSVKEAAFFYNINPSSLRHCISGKKKYIKNSKWSYVKY
jgi:group I intron endonuclease